jgi:hypothetical protein
MMTARIVLCFMAVTLGVATAQIATHQKVGLSALMVGAVLVGTFVGLVLRSRADRDRQLVRHGYMASNQVPWPPPVVEKWRV